MKLKLSKRSVLLLYGVVFLLLNSLSSCELIRNLGNNNNKPDLEEITTTKKDTTGKQPVDPDNNIDKDPVIVEKVDTIIWIDTLQENKFKQLVIQYTKIGKNPLVKDTLDIIDFTGKVEDKYAQKREVRKKASYNVAIILPFMTNTFNYNSEIPGHSIRAIEFYEGIEVALDSLKKEGVNMMVKVYDSERSEEAVKELLEKPEMGEMDLIIGPIRSRALKAVADFGKRYQIPVISCFNNNPKVGDDNHFYIQVNPTYEVHSRYVVELITEKLELPPAYTGYKEFKYLLVGTADDTLRMNAIQEAYAIAKNDEEARLPQVVLDPKTVSIDQMKKYFEKMAVNVVIVPSYRSEPFVTGVLRELHSQIDLVESRLSYRFVVVGMPQWKYYERINYEYYENLNLHISDPYYVDESASANIKFKDAFRSVYGMPPREFAYMGFDNMLYFGRLLKKYGTGFPDHFNEEIHIGRHGRFYFEPMMRSRKVMENDEIFEDDVITRFENQYVHLIEFDDYEFKPINTGFIKAE